MFIFGGLNVQAIMDMGWGGGGEKLIQMEISVSNVRKKIKNHQPPLFTFLSFFGDGEGGGVFLEFYICFDWNILTR